jgi:hypothetical protein
MKCRRGGTCTPFIIGGAPTENGHTFRLCSRCAEVWVTDRIALNIPAQVVVGPRRTAEEREEAYA